MTTVARLNRSQVVEDCRRLEVFLRLELFPVEEQRGEGVDYRPQVETHDGKY